MPRAFPLSSAGKTEVKMAKELTFAIAEPIPWRARKTISQVAELAKAHRKVVTVRIMVPYKKILFRPHMSANRPAASSMAVDDKVIAVTTQPSKTASMESSFPIVGRATVTADIIRVPMNEAMALTVKVTLLVAPVLRPFSTLGNTPDSLK
jgi:hypothetical protein